ncbi:MAG: hypothetical protein V1839_03035 [archaeon]
MSAQQDIEDALNALKLWRKDTFPVRGAQKNVLEAILIDNETGKPARFFDIKWCVHYKQEYILKLLDELCHAQYIKQHGTYPEYTYTLWHTGMQVFDSEYQIKTNVVRTIDRVTKEKQFEWIYPKTVAKESGLGLYSLAEFYLKGLRSQKVVLFEEDAPGFKGSGLGNGAKLTPVGLAIADYLNSQKK